MELTRFYRCLPERELQRCRRDRGLERLVDELEALGRCEPGAREQRTGARREASRVPGSRSISSVRRSNSAASFEATLPFRLRSVPSAASTLVHGAQIKDQHPAGVATPDGETGRAGPRVARRSAERPRDHPWRMSPRQRPLLRRPSPGATPLGCGSARCPAMQVVVF